jgi:hypothetical protein
MGAPTMGGGADWPWGGMAVHGEGTLGLGKGAPATGAGWRPDIEAPAMEVLKVEDDSDIWVPHGQWWRAGEGRSRQGHNRNFARSHLRVSVCGLCWHARLAEKAIKDNPNSGFRAGDKP